MITTKPKICLMIPTLEQNSAFVDNIFLIFSMRKEKYSKALSFEVLSVENFVYNMLIKILGSKYVNMSAKRSLFAIGMLKPVVVYEDVVSLFSSDVYYNNMIDHCVPK